MQATRIADNISKLLDRVRSSAENCHRGNSDILVLAVSKTRPADDIRAAHAAGLCEFGENYVQEALPKIAELADLPLVWHFIGPIQSNKTRDIAQKFDWVHSLERVKIARRLNEQRPEGLAPLQVCIQVNISGEQSKSGVAPADVPALASQVVAMQRLELRGLMAVPAAGADRDTLHRDFARLREALEAIQAIAPGADTLSMGMSGDMDIAIAEGATIVRIGTAIFGPRER
jgi:pyridoxal phosphate enzyme (YggS family)